MSQFYQKSFPVIKNFSVKLFRYILVWEYILKNDFACFLCLLFTQVHILFLVDCIFETEDSMFVCFMFECSVTHSAHICQYIVI